MIKTIKWLKIQEKMEGYSAAGMGAIKKSLELARVQLAREYVERSVVKGS